MNCNPNKDQQYWHTWLRDTGCYVCSKPAAIHHIKGSKMKLKGCIKPGEWYVIPLCYDHHQGEKGIHTNKKSLNKDYGTEKEMFASCVSAFESENDAIPMHHTDYDAIMERA